MFRPASAITIEDLRTQARRRLPSFLFEPMETGAGIGAGSARNRDRLKRWLLLPRALVDLAGASQAQTVFGREYASPFGLSAIGYAGNFKRDADRLFADAAKAADVPFILSGGSNLPIERIAPMAPDHVWYQLYGARMSARTDHMLGRARDCGVPVLVFTVDFPVAPRVEKLMRSGVRPPGSVSLRALPRVLWELSTHPAWTIEFLRQGGTRPLESWAPYVAAGAGAAEIAKDYSSQIPSNQTWRDVERIRKAWPGKLVIKGILRPEDALRAADLGADAVTVSNHGSVKLDCLPATIDVLPLIVQALNGRMPVFFDGGIRAGPDILVAMCLGASFCFLGRAPLYGAICGGRAGVDRAIQILRDDLTQTMAMIGCPRIVDLDRSFLMTSPF
jgi:(S)-mandelate dehydrogenase